MSAESDRLHADLVIIGAGHASGEVASRLRQTGFSGSIALLGRAAPALPPPATIKHALLRDAAYNSLLLSHQRRLHESCALYLEQHYQDVVQSEPELLAYHFAQAGLAAKATDFAELAGDRAADRFAFSEGVMLVGAVGMANLSRSPQTSNMLMRWRVGLQGVGVVLVVLLMLTGR